MPNFTAGTSFTDGVTNDVTAAKLNALVADAVPTANLSLNSTTGTISNFTASTANITLGTIPNFTASTANITLGTISNFTASTANITNGTISNAQFITATLGSSSRNIDAFPSGTKILFQQTSAPTGWTKSTTHNNKALRVVSGTAGSGGSVDFTTAFASQTPSGSVSVSGTVGNTTLSISQIPSHAHSMYTPVLRAVGDVSGSIAGGGLYNTATPFDTGTQGGGGSHTHSFSGSGSFTGSAIDISVQYVDIIIATKD